MASVLNGKFFADKNKSKDQERRVQREGQNTHWDMREGVDHGGKAADAAGSNLIGGRETINARCVQHGTQDDMAGVQEKLLALFF